MGRIAGELSKSVNCFDTEGLSYVKNLNEIIKDEKIEGMKCRYESYYDRKLNDEQPYRRRCVAYIEEAEEKISEHALKRLYDEMTPEQKDDYVENANRLAKEVSLHSSIKYTIPLGLMGVAQLGGFATYTLMSTVLSSVSASTLSFSTYVSASTGMSFLIGTGGISIVAIIALSECFSANTQKIIPIVVIIGDIRRRIKYEENINNK